MQPNFHGITLRLTLIKGSPFVGVSYSPRRINKKTLCPHTEVSMDRQTALREALYPCLPPPAQSGREIRAHNQSAIQRVRDIEHSLSPPSLSLINNKRGVITTRTAGASHTTPSFRIFLAVMERRGISGQTWPNCPLGHSLSESLPCPSLALCTLLWPASTMHVYLEEEATCAFDSTVLPFFL